MPRRRFFVLRKKYLKEKYHSRSVALRLFLYRCCCGLRNKKNRQELVKRPTSAFDFRRLHFNFICRLFYDDFPETLKSVFSSYGLFEV